jgi:hypothetical protein
MAWLGTTLTSPLQFWVMINLIHSFLMYLFYASTCFEQQVLIILTVTADSHSPECVIPDVLIQFGPADDEHLLLERVSS